MVSTHQQYLCPDFLNPSPPSTMDSSPLALLAQTCNSIGLPDTPNVSATTLGKSSKHNENGKHHHHEKSKDDASKNHGKTAANSSISSTSAADSTSDASHANARSSSASSKDSACANSSRDSPRKSENRSRGASQQQSNVTSSDASVTKSAADQTAASTSQEAKISAANKCVGAGANLCFPGAYPPALFPPYFSGAAAFPYASAPHLPPLTAFGSCYPSFPSTVGAAGWLPAPLSGYPPKCTDPYCKTCPAMPGAAAARGTCAVGCPCAQCMSHADLSLWLSYNSLLGQSFHGTASALPASYYAAAAAAAHNSAGPSASVAVSSASVPTSAASGAPQHTCSWMTGNEFCGKRFASSEELLQHLRTHTSQDSLKTPVSTTAAAMTPAAVSAPGRLSPRSTYLNSLNALRYHPYGKLSAAGTSPAAAAAAAALASVPFQVSFNPAAFNPLSSLCGSLSAAAQRLPGSLPHP